MSEGWKEVARLTFKGERFKGHALDLSALTELSQFQRLVAETAKALWRAKNPDRKNLPPRFVERTRLCLRRVEEGSAVVPLEIYVGDLSEEGLAQESICEDLWEDEPEELKEALDVATKVFHAVGEEHPLPESFPRFLVPEYLRWGKTLEEYEEIELSIPQEPTSRTSRKHIERLSAFCVAPYEARVDISGEVLAVNLRNGWFEIWPEGKKGIPVEFSPEQESSVTSALRDHRAVRMHLKGQGKVSPDGTLLRILDVDELIVLPISETQYDPSARPIEDIFAEIAGEVPEDEWRRLPEDLTDQLDHYIYGVPKQ